MITDKESAVSLRIASKTMSCIEISKILDWQPSKQFEKGETWGGKQNPSNVREECLWVYDLDLDERVLFEEKLQILVDMMLQKKERFQRILNECQIDIFCGYTIHNDQGGFMLEAKLMRNIALFNIDFLINFYVLPS